MVFPSQVGVQKDSKILDIVFLVKRNEGSYIVIINPQFNIMIGSFLIRVKNDIV